MSKTADSSEDRLRAVLRRAELPTSVREAWDACPPLPAPGQLWRARWQETRVMVLVLEAPSRSVRAAPVTLDAEMADTSAVILEQGESDLVAELVVWMEDTTSLPVRVLDRFMGMTHSRGLAGEGVLRRGRAVVTPKDERLVRRAQLQDAFEVFVQARWAPEGRGNLVELLGGLEPRVIAEELGISPRDAIAIRRGQRALSPEQATQLAPSVGRSTSEILAANPRIPEGLIEDLDLPEYRRLVMALARRRGVLETEAWVGAAYGVMAVAHRRTEGEEPEWRDRLDQYFEAVLRES